MSRPLLLSVGGRMVVMARSGRVVPAFVVSVCMVDGCWGKVGAGVVDGAGVGGGVGRAVWGGGFAQVGQFCVKIVFHFKKLY